MNALGKTILRYSSSLGTRCTDVLPANLSASVSELPGNQISEVPSTDGEPLAFSSRPNKQEARFPLSSSPVSKSPSQGGKAQTLDRVLEEEFGEMRANHKPVDVTEPPNIPKF